VVLAVSVEFCFVIWAVARLLATDVPAGTAALLASAFPIGMAVGRTIGPENLRRLVRPVNLRRGSALLPGGVLAAAGTLLVTTFDSPVMVTVGLALAGLGVATLYPIVLADLISIPGVSPAHLASLSAFASGTAILLAPAALAALAGILDLRTAFLIPLPLLAILLLIHRPTRPAVHQS
jgi:MFS family permease